MNVPDHAAPSLSVADSAPNPAPFRAVPPGGTLGVFAGSGPFDSARLAAGWARLEARGFRLVSAPDLDARHGFLAGPDAARVRGLEALLARSDVDALIAARGGYGLTRILARLDPAAFRAAAKPVIGFSDVTALHALLVGAGLEVIHGPVLTQLAELGDPDVDGLCQRLLGAPGPRISADGPTLRSGRAEGRLFGGNLAVLAALLGTPFLRPPPEGFLLLLEDVGEKTYRLDRLLTQLRSSGFLANARGIVLGDFHRCDPAQEGHPTASEVLEERLGDLGIPVLAGLPIGHGSRNRAVPLGRRARLDADAGLLEVLG